MIYTLEDDDFCFFFPSDHLTRFFWRHKKISSNEASVNSTAGYDSCTALDIVCMVVCIVRVCNVAWHAISSVSSLLFFYGREKMGNKKWIIGSGW